MKKTLTLLLLLFSIANYAQQQTCVGASPKQVLKNDKQFLEHSFKLIDSIYAVEKVKISNDVSVCIESHSCNTYTIEYKIKFKHTEGATTKELLGKGLKTLSTLAKSNISPFELENDIKEFSEYINSPKFNAKYYEHIFSDKGSYFQKQIEKVIVAKDYDVVSFKLWINL